MGSHSELGIKIKNEFQDRRVMFLHDIHSLDINDYHSVKFLVIEYPDEILDTAADINVEKTQDQYVVRKVNE